MKIITSLLLIITTIGINSQSKKPTHSDYWAIGVNAGIMFPLGDMKKSYNRSANIGLELNYNRSRNFALILEGRLNFLSSNDTNIVGSTSYVEATAGGRYYIGKSTSRFFIEAETGLYILDYSLIQGNGNQTSSTSAKLGINGGIGFEMSSFSRTQIYVKSKYHTIFTTGKITNYIGIYGGLKFII